MYLRVTTVHRGNRAYRYAQLVESYRRADGKPTNRVLASLGALDDVAISNLRTALGASREGKMVVLPSEISSRRPKVRVRGNFRYLDLAVLLRLWRDLGLGPFLASVLGDRTSEVPAADIVAALVLQRCVAPASKLAAERWYPTTALPELQGVAVEQFNNSRVHRVLGMLDGAESALQEGLPRLLQGQPGTVTALLIDATDTWFVGRGPPLAQKGIDKEGIYRRRVGLVLLCDQRGYPLRWHTLSGRYHDPTALAEMAEEVVALPWAKGVPVIMDRAVGNAAHTERFDAIGLRYLTAVPSPEFESCGAPIPWDVLDAMQKEDRDEEAIQRLGQCAVAAGFLRVRDDRYVLDLGLIDKARSAETARTSQAVLAMQILATSEAEPVAAPRVVAARFGMSLRNLQRYLHLRPLIPAIRQRIAMGEADALSWRQLQAVADQKADEQASTFDTLLAAAPSRRRRSHRKRRADRLTYRARAVLSFNPIRFLEDRRADQEHLADVEARVADVNRRLAHPSSRRRDASALAEVESLLRKHGLGSSCSVRMDVADGVRRILLTRDEAAWSRRRRGDGLNLLIAHPEVSGTATELVARYFAKDAIEKDFQTIKSLVELRPIHHRTDPKLRAHVTICMLALLLQRVLAGRFADAPEPLSARAAIEILEPVRLNLVEDGGATYYTVTRPSPAAATVLHTLGTDDLTDDAKACEVLAAR